VPVGLAARLKRIPIITHDSDTVGGLANRIVGRWAKVHATGMPAKYYRYPRGSVHYVGIPLDARVQPVTLAKQAQFKSELDLPADSQLVLVVGGGNGSKKLNDLTVGVARELLKNHLNVHLINLTGPATYQATINAYKEALDKEERARVKVIDFTSDFYKYSGAADLIISRAGATSIAEFAVEGKACIIIPSPFLAAGHQLKNADLLKEHEAAVILPEETTAEELLVVVKELLQDDHRRWQLASNLKTVAKPGASEKLAKLILDTAKNE
jgi:UDP-N-acetylglucosamine--N-acetylmuramyl-(pentapeptide) pyrophosphoryl-undecaprenol N-acetylglucosamine transferase